MSWEQVGQAYRDNAEFAKQEAAQQPTECPIHLYPLEVGKNPGVLHCRFGGEFFDLRGQPIPGP